MKLGTTSTLLLAVCIAAGGATAPAFAADPPLDDVLQTDSESGRAVANGGSGIAAAIICGGMSRVAASTGMNPGVVSAAIAACAYMMLDGLFDFPW